MIVINESKLKLKDKLFFKDYDKKAIQFGAVGGPTSEPVQRSKPNRMNGIEFGNPAGRRN